ncbi:MAG TPA: hypothetical protein VL202_17440 [Pararhizobium sp.]|uniref:hypothetical protein n=1 Tax=Pararhizobium sp. TaxID=1977563 RepID=UPI002B536AF7|nr:hypothetical protein [Pararhizobium sp.]HTO32944.1 hypothetical protein [Pararhizobium sp.]
MEILNQSIDFLNKNSAAITAIATVVITFLTWFLAADSRKLRKAGSDPEVVGYLVPHPDGNGGVNFVVANVGQGPAFSVSFKFDCDEDDFTQHQVMLRNQPGRTSLSVLPQGEKIGSLFGVGYALFGNFGKERGAPLKPFQVKISYKDINGRKKSSSQQIDITQFMGLAGILSKPAAHEISDSLKKIEKHIAKMTGKQTSSAQLLDSSELRDEFRKSTKADNRENPNGD